MCLAIFFQTSLQNGFCLSPGAEPGGLDRPGSEHLDAALKAFYQAQYQEALGHYRAAFEEAEQAGESPELKGRILRGIGACWLALSDYRTALEQFLRARPYTIQGGNREDLAALDSNIGTVYVFQTDYENARRIYKRALGFLTDAPQSRHRPTILKNLAAIELRQERYRQAIEPLRSALRALEPASDDPADRNLEAAIHDFLGFAQWGHRNFTKISCLKSTT